MAPAQKRRKEDEKLTPSWIVSAAKATVAFISFGIISFVSTWAINLGLAVSKLQESVSVINEKQQFITPWFVDSINEIKNDLKELRKQVQEKK